MDSKLHEIFEPAVKEGYQVNVFMDLVASGKQTGSPWVPVASVVSGPFAHLNYEELKNQLERDIQSVGGHLAHLTLRTENDDAELMLFSQQAVTSVTRFSEYPVQSDETGKNVVRRLQSLEYLMRVVKDHGAHQFVLVTRDDAFFFGQVRLSSFNFTDPSMAVASIDCNELGVYDDDKVMLFGSRAAHNVLLSVFSQFWTADKRLETNNAESFWREFINMKGATSYPVSLHLLPTVDAAYQMIDGKPTLCVKEFYLCKVGKKLDSLPPFCVEA